MKTYKLTPLEELRLDKRRIKEERLIASQRLSYQLQYLNDNWGTLLTKGITSSIKIKISETIDNLSNSNTSVAPFITKKSTPWFNNAVMNIATANLPLFGSLIWRVTKPALIAYGAKKVSSVFFRRKKR